MSFVAGDIVQLTLYALYNSVISTNVFHYQVISPQVEYFPDTVLDAFITDVITPAQGLFASSMSFTQVALKNLTNGIDIGAKNYTVNGSVSGEGLPPFACYGYRLNRTNALTRHGHKRFMGIPESMQGGGTIAAGALTLANGLATRMAEHLIEDAQSNRNFDFAPVIIGRDLDAGGSYVLNLAKVNPVQSGQYVSISTQNTRKFGRGI